MMTKIPKEPCPKEVAGKTRWSLMPFTALEEVVRVIDFGAKNYHLWSWTGPFVYTLAMDAVLRHCTAWLAGENEDQESGLHPLAHACCWLLFIMWWQLNGAGTDDRRVE